MNQLLRIAAVVTLLFTAAVAYHGYTTMSAAVAVLKADIAENNKEAAGSIVMAHRAFHNDIADLRQAIDDLVKAVDMLSYGMEKATLEREHLHDNITKVIIKLNRHMGLHPSHKRAK